MHIFYWFISELLEICCCCEQILFLFSRWLCQSSEMLVIFKIDFVSSPHTELWSDLSLSLDLLAFLQDRHTVCNICSFITSHLILTNSYYCCCYYDYWKSYISISQNTPTNRDSKHCLMSDLLHWVWCFLCILDLDLFIKVKFPFIPIFPEGG